MNKIEEILNKRTEFLSLLDDDISKNESLHEEIRKNIKSLEESRENVIELSKQPEHTAFIPLCKRLYMQGTVAHTGEYMVTKQQQSYTILKTLDQTLKDIGKRINAQRRVSERAELTVTQLIDRKKLLLGERDEDLVVEQQYVKDEECQPLSVEVQNMPDEIRSDNGVAVKIGQFFEILEYEDTG